MTASQASPTDPGDPGEQVLPALPRDSEGPVFSEPWQAQAFAMAVRLHEQGHFTWTEWAAELSRHIGDAGPADTTDYYEHWLATLESIATSSRLTTAGELTDRKHAWQSAAEATPHGQPIELGAELAG
jgi:nitrile hydratase accessory protein